MGEKKYSLGGVPIIYIALVTALGFFEYGRSIDGAFGGLLLALMFSLLSLVGFIPVVGIILFWWLSGAAISWWSAFTGLTSTSLTASTAYWLAFIGVVILNIAITLVIILLIRS